MFDLNLVLRVLDEAGLQIDSTINGSLWRNDPSALERACPGLPDLLHRLATAVVEDMKAAPSVDAQIEEEAKVVGALIRAYRQAGPGDEGILYDMLCEKAGGLSEMTHRVGDIVL